MKTCFYFFLFLSLFLCFITIPRVIFPENLFGKSCFDHSSCLWMWLKINVPHNWSWNVYIPLFVPIRTLQTFGQYNLHAVLPDCSAEGRKLDMGRAQEREQTEAWACDLRAALLAQSQRLPKSEKCVSFMGNCVPTGKNAWGLIYPDSVTIKLSVTQRES